MKRELIHLLKAALNDFKRNKVRTVLTSLGITIGVLSVVMLIALGLGLKNYIKQQFESMGANLIILLPGSGFGTGSGGGFGGAGLVGGAEFDEKDVASLKKIDIIDYVVPMYMKGGNIKTGSGEEYGYIMGTNEEAFEILNIKTVAGEVFSKGAGQSSSKVAVIGNKIAEKLFEEPEKALGKTVRFEDQRFKVVGVTEKKGDNEMDSALFVPYKATYGSINTKKTFWTIYLGVSSKDNIEGAKKEAQDTLLKRYEEDDFSLTEQSEMLSTFNQIFNIVNGVLVAIGSISLLVGGIGIMNIMYATVTERTREIGIRRAIGATQRDILLQFLTESVVLSLFGGLAGLLSSALIVLIVRIFFPAAINFLSVAITLIISSAIGIGFGVFPAKRAAKLPPIEAIRNE